jgi:hypothetical protein
MRMKKTIAALLTLGFVLTATDGQSQEASSTTKEAVPPVMYNFLSHILLLEPFIISQQKFTADENKTFVESQLKAMSEMSDQLKKHKRLQTPGFQIPATAITQQMKDVYDAYQNDHRDYAWRSLRTTLNSCSQCHSQVPQSKAPVWQVSNDQLPKDPYARADFWFMTRSYDKAFSGFSDFIRAHKKSDDPFALARAFNKIFTIALRIERSPQKALSFIDSLNNRSNFNRSLNSEIKSWKSELNHLQKIVAPDLNTITPKEMETFAENIFRAVYPIAQEDRSKDLAMEYASGFIYEFINRRPKEASQRMLFWLGVSDIELNRYGYVSFGEPYLTQCIEKFQPTPISSECYSALEEYWIVGYSGSAGVFLPKSHKKELERLKKLIR